jgi:hypothetical protein
MKQQVFIVVLSMLVLTIMSCQPSGRPTMMTKLSTCDSAIIMYYNKPGNSRFFKMVKVYDRSLLRSLADNANQYAQKGSKDCISEGKIYFYGDKDEVYVLYFGDRCNRLSFIDTGEKYSVKLLTRSKKILDSLGAYAYEPFKLH